MKIDFDILRLYDHDLFDVVSNYGLHKHGIHDLRPDMFNSETWDKLLEFDEWQNPQAPPAPPPTPQRNFEAEVRADLDKAAANGRLLQLEREEGLLDVESNGKLISNFFRDHKLVLNVANVDKAVAALRSQLAWRPAPPAAASTPAPVAPVATPPAPAAPPEVLGMLPDGTRQLPLDATPTKHHSKEQLKDWLKRTREKVPAKATRLGHFGAKF